MKRRDLVKKPEVSGYRMVRRGTHRIYEKNGSRPVQVPDHNEINEYTAKAILKAAGLN
ncbi:MAG: type II toxin-antitoxin system HicA family toxin [Oscillospiraceae bacterium]|jgi:predicted RNA binding protein YcfA (HicA-like mRNA interferase family)|nr:type II toxin-antitoxin system HicA family toxin [Oscillospiraceae bacterium]